MITGPINSIVASMIASRSARKNTRLNSEDYDKLIAIADEGVLLIALALLFCVIACVGILLVEALL